MVLATILLALFATADASDTKDGVNHVRGADGGYIFTFPAHEDK